MTKKIKALIAVTAVIAMTFSTMVMAAPSPVAGTVTVTIPGSGKASSAKITTPTAKELTKLAEYISETVASMGMAASVKSTIKIEAPADYKGGDLPIVYAVAGLKDGASNVFAFILLPNGKKVMVPCSVKNGYVGFISPGMGTVSIVTVDAAASTAANATATVPTALH